MMDSLNLIISIIIIISIIYIIYKIKTKSKTNNKIKNKDVTIADDMSFLNDDYEQKKIKEIKYLISSDNNDDDDIKSSDVF